MTSRFLVERQHRVGGRVEELAALVEVGHRVDEGGLDFDSSCPVGPTGLAEAGNDGRLSLVDHEEQLGTDYPKQDGDDDQDGRNNLHRIALILSRLGLSRLLYRR